MSSSESNNNPATSAATPVPRSAVSVTVRYQGNQDQDPMFLLIERGNPPNKGVWCVPGGKTELGELTLIAAMRELREEVKFPANSTTIANSNHHQIKWFTGGAFCTSDSILRDDSTNGIKFHYVIAQCFAELEVLHNNNSNDGPPPVRPADDAQDAKWFTLEDIQRAEANQETVPNLCRVIERAEFLYQNGMLPTENHPRTIDDDKNDGP